MNEAKGKTYQITEDITPEHRMAFHAQFTTSHFIHLESKNPDPDNITYDQDV